MSSATDQKVKVLEGKVDSMDARLFPIPWKAVTVIAVVAWVIFGVCLSFFVYNYMPTQIGLKVEEVNTKVARLEGQVSGNTPTTNVDKKFADVDKRFEALESRMEKGFEAVNRRIDELMATLMSKPTKAVPTLRRALPKGPSESPEEAKAGYKVTRELLQRAKEKRTALRPQDFQELALPLLSLKYPDDNLNKEVWETVKEFASYRTIVNTKYGVPGAPHDVQAEPNYFRGVEQNLGERSLWKDTVFVDCQIKLDSAGAKLVLENVRFINCDFKPVEESAASKKLFEALFKSAGPAVNTKMLDFRLGNKGETGS